ncbi:hypothetical protein INT44_004268 [Umbelopsis vinacea]|uniref:t-SNARE coiled-coil homology domain-containing protein n=1 Tax=Umbelopsis vinacea TaxID=44442 RepID=A0A8H7UKA0_9FUNG|nr:hypothetical protein INT44_004268 [Umbelopsis vinacea]KAI9280550.1 t-SNARE [Umbelopsis sp. AD052]
MNVDRLAEFNRGNQSAPGQHVEMRPLMAPPSDPQSTQGFLDQISQLQDVIKSINENISRLRSLQQNYLQTSDETQQSRLRSQITSMNDDTNQMIKTVKDRVKAIEPTPRHPDLGIRKNQFANVSKSFMDSIERYRGLEIEFQKQEAQQLERQIKIANPNATSEEIDQAVHDAQTGSRPVFAQQLLGQRYQAQETLENVTQRHEEIQKLAQSINQLTELFQEMQGLLENQAHVLNTIEASSYEVVNEVEKGNLQLNQAVTLAKSTRRKKWIMFAVIATIIIVIVIIVVVKLVPQNKQ